MTELQATQLRPASRVKATTGRLFVLELSGDRIHSMSPDGTERKIIVTGCHFPDGIVVDVEARHIYWTNMGVPNLNDGSIERADLDGGNRSVIVPQGVTHTPKQIHLDKEHLSRDDRPSGHVADSRLLQDGACAARLEQSRVASTLRALASSRNRGDP